MKKKQAVREGKNKPKKVNMATLIQIFTTASERSAEWAKKLKSIQDNTSVEIDDVRLECPAWDGEDVTDEVIIKLAQTSLLMHNMSAVFGLEFMRDALKSK